LSNHLGNVLATISDKKAGVDNNSDGTVDYFTADVISANDYYPFGMGMPGRKYSIANTNYRYGFNGKENDNDIEIGAQDYGMRIYDTRLGRFLSVDPIAKSYPRFTPYQFASNIPISGIDLDGLEFLPRFNQSDPLSLTTWAFATKARELDNSRTGKIIHGLWNTAAGTVGMAASISYIASSDGTGAALGGVMAFNFSAGTAAIGISQMTEAFSSNSPKNDFLHASSTIPGLIAFGTGSKNAKAIDAFSGLLPAAFGSGNGKSLFSLSTFVKSGFGSIDAIKQFATSPSINSAIGMIDALKQVKDVGLESFQLLSEAHNPIGKEAAMNQNPVLIQSLSYKLSYKVSAGDNLRDIAKRFGTTVDVLAKQNQIQNPNHIQQGQKITFSNTVVGKSR
jgi:RHS repeat-associated protein